MNIYHLVESMLLFGTANRLGLLKENNQWKMQLLWRLTMGILTTGLGMLMQRKCLRLIMVETVTDCGALALSLDVIQF